MAQLPDQFQRFTIGDLSEIPVEISAFRVRSFLPGQKTEKRSAHCLDIRTNWMTGLHAAIVHIAAQVFLTPRPLPEAFQKMAFDY